MTNKIKESNISDSAVTESKIADNAITSAKIAPGAVVAADVNDGSITTNKLADTAVTNAKITDGTIANAKLAGSIANDKLTNSSITINGTSISLGASGDISAGTDWQAVKTTSFTAVAGEGYFVNTTSGVITVTLPASPTQGDEVHIIDYAGTFDTNNVTVARNGSNIDGNTTNGILGTNRLNVRFVYVDSTLGWTAVFDKASSSYGATFISATGGTETTSGNYKIHKFTSSSNFVVSSVGNPSGSTSVDYLVIAGGGGGGAGVPGDGGGGGGAGGARMSDGTTAGCYSASPLGPGAPAITVSVTTYPITVGGGGSLGSGVPGGEGSKGSNSVFSTITSTGGGAGDAANTSASTNTSGGSGGGSHQQGLGSGLFAGNTPPVSPPQGNPGGANAATPNAGGGGGAGGSGQQAQCASGGYGGVGISNSITGSSVDYAGGGGGGGSPSRGYPDRQGGGPSGGYGAGNADSTPRPATANTGGGGGGGSDNAAGNGGSGVVIIRYKYQ
jgi:hypothetical protein